MNVIELLENRTTPLLVDDFLDNTDRILNHYESINDKVSQEYILVSLLNLMNKDKRRKNLIINEIDEKRIKNYADISNLFIQRRFGIQMAQAFIVSLLLSIVSFYLLSNLMNLTFWIAMIISILVLILLIYSLFKTSSRRLVDNSKSLYNQKADKKVLEYINFYLS